jgi:hypothetical protein
MHHTYKYIIAEIEMRNKVDKYEFTFDLNKITHACNISQEI